MNKISYILFMVAKNKNTNFIFSYEPKVTKDTEQIYLVHVQ